MIYECTTKKKSDRNIDINVTFDLVLSRGQELGYSKQETIHYIQRSNLLSVTGYCFLNPYQYKFFQDIDYNFARIILSLIPATHTRNAVDVFRIFEDDEAYKEFKIF